MSERRQAERTTADAPAPSALRPRDAATLILVDRTGSAPRVLMGRRRPSQVFLPDTFVFPGGRVEAQDRRLARRHALPPAECAALKQAVRGRPSDARAAALALAALRETFEETGVIVGEAHAGETSDTPGAGWAAFLASGFRPRLAGLTFFARAITPPRRPRRYDTRFFLADASLIVHRAAAVGGELIDIAWFTLAEARTLPLPSITRRVIEDLEAHLVRPSDTCDAPVPFYFHRRGQPKRTVLPRTLSPA